MASFHNPMPSATAARTRHRPQPLNMLKIATPLLDIAGRGRIIGPLPDLGDPSLMNGPQQLSQRRTCGSIIGLQVGL
jgi:hypothetical protein